jgi:peptidoglycan hydrolase-like amidase
MGESSLPEVIFVRPTERDGLVYVNDRWYRGKVLIAAREKGILVVNHVDLEEYLYSVVGSEMHSTAPSEALKAQAIAARSYALVHMIRPASPWFNLGNTQRWQVYKGIGSEYQSSHNAVNATAGQILSYKGGVVESLYAATDEIVSWAHGGRGMSQTGAYQLADRGYDHQQILANYYPGVSVARLILQQ